MVVIYDRIVLYSNGQWLQSKLLIKLKPFIADLDLAASKFVTGSVEV